MAPRTSTTDAPSWPRTIGKFLDQPVLLSTLYDGMPPVLIGGAVLVGIVAVAKSPRGQRRKAFWKTLSVLTATVFSALVATRGLKINGKQVLKGLLSVVPRRESAAQQAALVEQFLARTNLPDTSREILSQDAGKILSPEQVRTLYAELASTPEGAELLGQLIPNPEALGAREIFGEIRDLSLLGLVPVVGGLAGGILGDVLTESDWRDRVPDKIKEGFYQFLANIFLCNVGAGIGLLGLEKLNIHSAAARAAAMTGGIVGVGMLGGGAIANFLGNKLIDPLFKSTRNKEASLYSERKPELVDVAIHLDDLPVIGLLAGWKWVGPLLPVLYSISGYRVGIGYRNVHQ